ncbi:MAG: HU family DNA-binding protein [Methanocorpusculum sp.]|nr:HU family DNA-binding protein [Oscillospiraceae bacterium]MBQ3569465.1 HU family DNA-binding protein [Methanocorpusculum sp.]
MNKQELVKKIAAESDISQKQAAVVLDNTLNAIVDAVAAGEKVQLIGFGTFEGKKREARVGRNPRTKESIEIPASVAPVFKAGREFKEKVKG